jgi:hypothetical protein
MLERAGLARRIPVETGGRPARGVGANPSRAREGGICEISEESEGSKKEQGYYLASFAYFAGPPFSQFVSPAG